VNTLLLTGLAMLAFAANSLLCRLALGDGSIDPATFTTVRVFSGALILILFMLPRWRTGHRSTGGITSAAWLFLYMAFFSFAYVSLPAGTGALVLFGAVQLTMFGSALRAGEHFAGWSWVGLGCAISGLVFLVAPGVTAPDPLGAVLMAVAGIAWGAYSLLGRTANDPLAATATSFIYCTPLVIVISLVFLDDFHASTRGVILAATSGAIASGCGYAIWYAALRGLSASRAATVQLSVPVIAALGGILLLSEAITLRLLVASAATLGGVAIVLAQRKPA
jgi:drug/metabolite transporter (DMT)-like permease